MILIKKHHRQPFVPPNVRTPLVMYPVIATWLDTCGDTSCSVISPPTSHPPRATSGHCLLPTTISRDLPVVFRTISNFRKDKKNKKKGDHKLLTDNPVRA